MTRIKVVTLDDEDSDLAALCRKYWEMGIGGTYIYKISELATEYKIKNQEVGKLVKSNSEAQLVDYTCSRCILSFTVYTRTELASFLRYPKKICSDCLTTEAQDKREAQAALNANMQETIRACHGIVDDHSLMVDPSLLPIRQAFAIAALMEDGDSVMSGITTPLKNRIVSFAPSSKLEADLLGELVRGGLLRIHPTSPLDAFDWVEGQYSGSFYTHSALFYLPGSGPLGDRVDVFRKAFNAIAPQNQWPSKWHEDFAEFWLELCMSECEGYLLTCLERRSLDLQPGDKTRDTIRRGLQWFTLGQMFYFIWKAAAGAADYYTRSDVSKPQAANSAVTRLASSIDKAYSAGWNITPYQRNNGDQESTIWHLLATRALNLTDPMSFAPLVNLRSATGLSWASLDAEGFERLIFQMVDEASGYEEAKWLMHPNAPDHGRDVSAVRAVKDSLGGQRSFRVVIQCKHWLAKSIRDDDIAKEVVSVEHWQNPPFDVLVIVTSGKFTADAVTWTERHNARGVRPYIEIWNDAHLESLLSERQHLILAFELR